MLTLSNKERTDQAGRYLRQLGLAGLLVVLAVTTSSAYLRLRAAGFGCADWPACYGQSAVIAEPRGQSFQVARVVHRLTAALAGAAILGVGFIALSDRRRFRRELIIAAALMVLAFILARLGRATPGSPIAAIAIGNLLGGMSMAALFALLAFGRSTSLGTVIPKAILWITRFAIVLTMTLLALGAFTSATFSGFACPSFPDCNAQWWPSSASPDAFNPWQSMRGDMPVGGAAVHMAHRYLALVVAALCLGLAELLRKMRGKPRQMSFVLASLVTVQVAVGILMILLSLPFPLAITHNVCAALLLVALVVTHEALKHPDSPWITHI